MTTYRNPSPCVDIIIYEPGRGIVLIERKNPPLGWALPGGFIDYGESAESAAEREALEETCLEVEILGLVGVYSEPDRDPRQHTLSITYAASARDISPLAGGDDAARAVFFELDNLPELAFDHAKIIADFKNKLGKGEFAYVTTR